MYDIWKRQNYKPWKIRLSREEWQSNETDGTQFLEQWKYCYWYMLLYINIMWYCNSEYMSLYNFVQTHRMCNTKNESWCSKSMDFGWLWFVVGGSLIVTNVPYSARMLVIMCGKIMCLLKEKVYGKLVSSGSHFALNLKVL